MIEKRRSKRVPIHITLSISEIYKQKKISIQNLDAPIQVVDISAHGIGLVTECILPMGYHFNAKLSLHPDQPLIDAVVSILRVNVVDADVYLYGCEFMELADSDRDLIGEYANANIFPISV